MRKESMAFVLSAMILISVLFSSLPFVFAAEYKAPFSFMPPEVTYAGDVNKDGIVNILDVVAVTSRYGSKVGDPNYDAVCDVNKDGKIDILDLTIVTSNYGKLYYSLLGTPVAYSESFEFTFPDDGDDYVYYWIQIRFYVPASLSGKTLWVTVDREDLWDSCTEVWFESGYRHLVNWTGGSLAEGYYMLHIQYLEYMGGGKVTIRIRTYSGESVWLDRFRIIVPNYSDTEVRYTVKTSTYFPGDEFFLGGYADDYIDTVKVDVGLKWHDWMWNCTSYDTIYAWGDGFMYPLGWQTGWHTITFTFGEIWGGGSLDFQYISWTNQKDKIGKPKFYAVGNLNRADYITINSAMFYGGSRWKFEDDPEFSERYFEARQIINATYDDGDYWFTTSFEVGLGLGWAEWALLPATEDDVGITLNLTCQYWNSNKGMGNPYQFWTLDLRNITLDVYSFPALEIKGMEYQEHDSFVKSDGTAAVDYMGSVIMFMSGILLPTGTPAIIGGSVGLGIKGLAAIIKIAAGQYVSYLFDEILSEPNHYQLNRDEDFPMSTSTNAQPFCDQYESDVVFFKLNPAAGRHCGLTKVVVHGRIDATHWAVTGHAPFREPVWSTYIGDIAITICIPWFLRG